MTTETLESVISTQCPACRLRGEARPACESCSPPRSRPLVVAPVLDRWSASIALRRALGPAWLRPAAVQAALEPRALRPILVPAWTLEVDVESCWQAGERRSGTRRFACRGLVLPAVEGPAARVVEAALAASASAPRELEPEAFSEWRPVGVTRHREEAWTRACEHLAETATEEAALGLSLDETEHLRVETRFENALQRPLLVPAWRAAGPGFELLVEACGGRVLGSAPWHGPRLAGLAAAGGGILGLLAVLL